MMMMWKSIWLVSTFFGWHDGKEPTDRLIPPGYVGNPWGPAANAAREAGELPPIELSPTMQQWDAWGRAVLKDGDVLFRRGDARLLFGYFPFSRFLANVSGSLYSHTGLAAIEDGKPYVYDMTKAGVRRQPFHVWILDNAGPFAVKRPRPHYAEAARKAVAFCRDVYTRQVPFDYDLGLDDSAFYCVELTEKSYRAAGVPLSDPVVLAEMERVDEFPICIFAFQKISNLTLDQQVFFPGNERHGIWSSPVLTTIYASTTASTAAGTPRAGSRTASAAMEED